jgi:hypothetical protein
MWPATAWTDDDWVGQHARGWTVTGALEARRVRNLRLAAEARKRIEQRALTARMMTATSWVEDAADDAAGRWRGGPNVLAFLFAHPDSEAMKSLDLRGEYFDHRTGDTWDLFFPGYYRATDVAFERRVGARPVGQSYLGDWFFHPRDFDTFRRRLEGYTQCRWHYSGGTDLVLVSGWVSAHGKPSVYWDTAVSGCVTDETTAVLTLSLPEVIERVTRDVENTLASADFGVGDVTGRSDPDDPRVPSTPAPRATRDVLVNAVGGILAQLGAKAMGAN